MSSPTEDLTRLLIQVNASGSFATRRTAPCTDLRLDVKGVGRLKLPITPSTALKLCAAGLLARHGYKDRTRLDRRVRDTWEIPKRRISIDQRTWNRTLQPHLTGIRRDLGLPETCHLKAALHNLLIYEPGQFFVTHQDSEKASDMIGTLVAILPSAFTGGEVVIEHHDQKVTFSGARAKIALIAFYADCHHQVRAVKRGYRVALTYNLILDRASEAAHPTPPTQVAALVQGVRRFFDTAPAPRWVNDRRHEPPDRLVYLLDHQYTQRGLDWNRLKGPDAVRAAALRDVARQLDCEIFLALADVHETWSCEDVEFGYSRSVYGYRDGRRCRIADEDEALDDGDAGTPELTELLESEIELRHWVGAGEWPEAISASVADHELCYTKASVAMKPFKSEHEGYMGNYGNTVDRWYHRAAVVLWPRERTFLIRAKASARWAISEVAGSLKSGRIEEARDLTKRLLPFWAAVAQRESGPGFGGRTLRVAEQLQRPDLAGALLAPFTLACVASSTARQLVALLDGYGLEWCRTLLRQWGSNGRDRAVAARSSWVKSTLPALCRHLCTGSSPHGITLAQWLAAEQWTWIVEKAGGIRTGAMLRQVVRQLIELNRAILSVIESSGIARHGELHEEILRVLTTCAPAYPVRALVDLLETAHDRFTRDGLSSLGMKPLHAHCVRELTTRLAAPARAADDWSIAARVTCSCTLCASLVRFLRAPDQVRLDWPLAKHHRAHIHEAVDLNDLPVSHVTRRTGRPFTLVLEKTDAVFTRDAAERRSWESDLKWLRMTAESF